MKIDLDLLLSHSFDLDIYDVLEVHQLDKLYKEK